MISRLSGILLAKNPPQVVVDVHGVGYELEVPMSTFYSLPENGEKLSLLTHFAVREDGQFLFGFATESERFAFRQLLKISGVGARMALSVLSGLSVSDLAQVVSRQEVGRLTKVPGIGTKAAERLLPTLIDAAKAIKVGRTDQPAPATQPDMGPVITAQHRDRVLDLAGGTGDLARAFARKVGDKGTVVHTDINEAMLRRGRDRLLDEGLVLPTVICDAELLPFASGSFDLVSVAFGLRNMTHKERALAEMNRVLRPGGRLLVLEFSKVAPPLAKAYDWYSFNVLPRIGQLVAGDAASYRYLAESIRMHPGQAELKAMMKGAGFGHVDVHNLSAGVVALHVGIKC